MKKQYVNHSGGCPGSDMTWELLGEEYGVLTIAYSFYNHVQYSKNQKVLTHEELSEGFYRVKIASKSLKRTVVQLYPYVKNLISRNWFQVKNSDAVFAIGTFGDETLTWANGGTGWAIQMAIDVGKSVYLFDQNKESWFVYNFDQKKFIKINYIPTLTVNFAGIGTRQINDVGLKAIHQIYEYNFAGD